MDIGGQDNEGKDMKVSYYIDWITNWITGSKEEYSRKAGRFFGKDERRINKELEKNRKNLKTVIIVAVALLLLLTGKSMFQPSGIKYDEKGNGAVIHRQNIKSSETFNLTVETGDIKKDVAITFSPEKKKQVNGSPQRDDQYYINQMVNGIKASKGEEIILPTQLPNGKEVRWSKPFDVTPIYFLFIVTAIVMSLRQSRYTRLRKHKASCQASVIRKLPSFINRIVITWKSGCTFNDSLKKATIATNSQDFFSQEINRLLKKSEETGENYLRLFNDFAVEVQVKELKKLSNIMVENQDKGSFLLDKLEREREMMWEKRKKLAKEDGKKAETKLVIPMTILLMALIVVTAAPAFLMM